MTLGVETMPNKMMDRELVESFLGDYVLLMLLCEDIIFIGNRNPTAVSTCPGLEEMPLEEIAANYL